ncbi:MAG: CoA transferase [Rhodospirillales bacterium]|nr:CoA transferase [Rhodospirillales bacterium]
MTERTAETQSAPHKPLAGLVAVELGHSVAAPVAGHVLADLGATLIKIENPSGGDDARNWGPPFWHGASAMFQALNRNKFSAAIDLKDPGELAALHRFLVEETDIIVQNMRPGLVDKIGIGADALRAVNPRLIYCNLWAFGRTGPLKNRPGYDPLMQAFGGIMSITGEEGRPPVRVGPSIVDQGTGMWAVIGILSALHRRSETGEGSVVDTSLYETALSWIGTAAASFHASGEVPKRRGSEMSGLVPYKVYEAADGYILIAAGNDNLFRHLAEAVGHPEWLEDPVFATNPERVRNRDTVNGAVQKVIETRSRAEWQKVFDDASVPSAPLQTVDQVVEHAQTQALEICQQTPDGAMSLVGLPLSFDGVRPPLVSGPPKLGADSALILKNKDAAE